MNFPRDLPGQERYVRRVMANLAIDRHRRRSREVVGVGLDAAVAAPDPVEALDVREALRALSARQRRCVVLRYYEQKSSAEIAAELSISAGAVRRYLHDGLQAMKVALAEREERAR